MKGLNLLLVNKIHDFLQLKPVGRRVKGGLKEG